MHEINQGCLDGIIVLDVGQAYQGPYAGFLCAREGATVIKIEPKGGDQARNRSSVSRGASLPFAILNANKKSLALDLKSEEGREVFLQLVSKADVLIENFAPGVMDRLGLGWNVLRQKNTRLIYGSATGYGLNGENRDNLAMDLIVQAHSGLASLTGMPDTPPVKAGGAVADIIGGIHLFAGLMTALQARHQGGKGRLVEVAMVEALIPVLISTMGLVQGGAQSRKKSGNKHAGFAVAPWNAYECSDGWVAIVCVSDRHWSLLSNAMGAPEFVEDPRFKTNKDRVMNMDMLDEAVTNWTKAKKCSEVVEKLAKERLPVASYRTIEDVLNDQALRERKFLLDVEHPELGKFVTFDSPIKIHDSKRPPWVPSRKLGADARDVLSNILNYSEEEIESFLQ